ncbi:hypothetical protein PGT21_013412 [Puccinia graminis f. sp. tritici]|uniref:Uncharacterized protein n=1 Tax=Puccinia graminis f. sp. tritici TaxID=56615 RepID=A0A5B0R0G8_PUCGR|nr:hypothetical protein PGT21_013412 [Puccinia graminis f. sp. tritici]
MVQTWRSGAYLTLQTSKVCWTNVDVIRASAFVCEILRLCTPQEQSRDIAMFQDLQLKSVVPRIRRAFKGQSSQLALGRYSSLDGGTIVHGTCLFEMGPQR